MNALNYAVVGMIQADPVMQALLYSYGGSPAVFTFIPVPEVDPGPPPVLPLPFIVTEDSVSDVFDDTTTTVGHKIKKDIRCYDLETNDPTKIQTIAMRIKDIFHRQESTMTKYILNSGDAELFTVTQCWANGPRPAPHQVDEYVQGRIITLNIRLTRIPSSMPYAV
jgi:hypothetical protein